MADLYNHYYGLKTSPFNITPDPGFLYFSPKHREALNHMVFGITQRKGFIQITGEVGSGKTTICRALLERLGERFTTALILNPCVSEVELLRAILHEFGRPVPSHASYDRMALLDALNKFLLAEVAAGRDVVLIIDEAQDLSFEMLEQVRLLSNLETNQRKLLQIVLIGQPELRDKINDRRLRQLRQRITVRYHLSPLSWREVDEYIRHRLTVSGAGSDGDAPPTFSFLARARIYRYSGGIPRLVNAVCDKALLCGFVEGADRLKLTHIRRAIRELEGIAA